jgi:uncharacterized protein (TIGR00106 family)
VKVILEISILPLGGSEHLSEPIASFLKVIQEEGIPFELGPMGTTLEGEWGKLFSAIEKGCKELLRNYPRVYGVIKFDLGKPGTAEDKVRKVKLLLSQAKESP